MADVTSAASTTAATGNRKVWQKSAYDVADQTTSTATNVGFLRANDSRVDVISTMDTSTKTQVFSFTNLTTANVQLAQQGNNTLRVQVLNQGGQVIADSKSGMGQASKTYTDMTQGTYKLKQGQYYLQVSRTSTTPSTNISYNVQLKEGSTVNNDYITQTSPEPANLQHQQAVESVAQIAPNALNSTGPLSGTAADPFGLGGYNIFGQKTS
jgi:hypothetical protein